MVIEWQSLLPHVSGRCGNWFQILFQVIHTCTCLWRCVNWIRDALCICKTYQLHNYSREDVPGCKKSNSHDYTLNNSAVATHTLKLNQYKLLSIYLTSQRKCVKSVFCPNVTKSFHEINLLVIMHIHVLPQSIPQVLKSWRWSVRDVKQGVILNNLLTLLNQLKLTINNSACRVTCSWAATECTNIWVFWLI